MNALRIFMLPQYLETQKDFLREHNLSVEILFDKANKLLSMTKKDLEHVQYLVNWIDHPFSIHGPLHGLNPGSEDLFLRNYSIQSYLRAIEIAGVLGADKVVLHTGFTSNMGPPWRQMWFDTFLDVVKLLVQTAERNGIILLLENTWEKEWDLFEVVFNEIDSPNLKMVFDVAHAYLFSQNTIEEWLNKFSDKIIYYHFCDTDGSRDNHMAIGEGILNWPDIKQLIDATGVNPDFTLEITPEDYIKSIPTLKQIGILKA